MSKTIVTALSIFAMMMVFLVFMNVFEVITYEQRLKQVDEFLTRKVSIHRAFTPEVESELMFLLSSLNIDYSNIDFSGTTTDPVEWGESARVYYEFKKNIVQKGMDYMGLAPLEIRPRDYLIPVLGR